MELRGEHETKTVGLENPLDLRRLQVHTGSEGLEQVRAPAAAGDRSISVLRHSHAGGRDDEHCYRGNVERGQPSSACPTQVDNAPSSRDRMRTDRSRIAVAMPAISSGPSPFIRSPIRNAPICAGVACESMISAIAAYARSKPRDAPVARSPIAS